MRSFELELKRNHKFSSQHCLKPVVGEKKQQQSIKSIISSLLPSSSIAKNKIKNAPVLTPGDGRGGEWRAVSTKKRKKNEEEEEEEEEKRKMESDDLFVWVC